MRPTQEYVTVNSRVRGSPPDPKNELSRVIGRCVGHRVLRRPGVV